MGLGVFFILFFYYLYYFLGKIVIKIPTRKVILLLLIILYLKLSTVTLLFSIKQLLLYCEIMFTHYISHYEFIISTIIYIKLQVFTEGIVYCRTNRG